jgi:hypothetical protein
MNTDTAVCIEAVRNNAFVADCNALLNALVDYGSFIQTSCRVGNIN